MSAKSHLLHRLGLTGATILLKSLLWAGHRVRNPIDKPTGNETVLSCGKSAEIHIRTAFEKKKISAPENAGIFL